MKDENRKIFGYKCKTCGRVYSDLEADLAKFDICVCGNTFKDSGKYEVIRK